MTDERLKPATRDDLVQAVAHGLQFEGCKRIHHADEFMARIAAEKLVDHIQRCNYVVMKRPSVPAHSSSPPPSAREDE